MISVRLCDKVMGRFSSQGGLSPSFKRLNKLCYRNIVGLGFACTSIHEIQTKAIACWVHVKQIIYNNATNACLKLNYHSWLKLEDQPKPNHLLTHNYSCKISMYVPWTHLITGDWHAGLNAKIYWGKESTQISGSSPILETYWLLSSK